MSTSLAKYYFLIRTVHSTVLCLFLSSVGFSQITQSKADSALKVLIENQEINDVERVKLLRLVAANSSNPEKKIHYAQELISIAERTNSFDNAVAGYHFLGYGYMRSGRITKAIENYFQLMKLADSLSDNVIGGDARLNMASAFKIGKDFTKAKNLELQAIDFYNRNSDRSRLLTAYLNLGNTYYYLDNFDSALITLSMAKFLDKEQSERQKHYIQSTESLVYGKLSRTDTAELLLTESIKVLESYEDHYAVADCKVQFGTICYENGQTDKAIGYLLQGYELARQHGLKEQVQDGALMLSKIFEEKRNYPNALKYQKEYYTYRDSLVNAESIRQIADERTNYEVGLKQAELDVATAEKKNREYFLIGTGIFTLLILGFALYTYRNFLAKKKINLQLEMKKIELEELNSTKDRFFSIISHDLRGPVNAFHGVSKLIKFMVQQKQMDQLEELAEHIDDSVDRLSSLLDNLLNWAVQQQGQFTYVPEKIEVQEMITDLVKTFATMAEGKKIAWHQQVEEGLYTWTDSNTTMTIMRNLVSNALKFTPEGGTVSLSARSTSAGVELQVSDTGVGIPREKLENLFKLQAQKSTWGTAGEKGLGIGLQLVHEFVQLNQGQIDIHSEPDKGTTFTILLPAYSQQLTAQSAVEGTLAAK